MPPKGSTPFWKSASLSGRISSSENERVVAAGPVSRILSALRRDGHSSGPRITARLKRPTRRLWRAEPARVPGKAEASLGNPSLFGLAPCGVCPARRITAAAVRSYRTFSPLPEPCGPGGMFSVALSVERSRPYKRGGPPGRYPAHCSAEFGLSSRLATSDRPVRLPTHSL
jgi:hypothetical protein